MEQEFWNHTMVGADIEKYTTRFHELARLVPHMANPEEKRIDRYLWGLAPEISGMVTSAEPTTIESAVALAHRLTENAIRIGTLLKGSATGKRKADETSGKLCGGNFKKGKKTAKNFGIAAQPIRQYQGTNPFCNKCNFHHSGDCPVCKKCNQVGHHAKYCKNKRENPKPKGGCYECGNPNHFKNVCPTLNRVPNNAAVNQEGQTQDEIPRIEARGEH